MELLGESWAYVVENQGRFIEALLVHLRLSLTALGLAIAIFFPLGVLVSRGGTWANGILAGVAAARVIPSLAVILLLLPIFGLGWRPALIALTLLA